MIIQRQELQEHIYICNLLTISMLPIEIKARTKPEIIIIRLIPAFNESLSVFKIDINLQSTKRIITTQYDQSTNKFNKPANQAKNGSLIKARPSRRERQNHPQLEEMRGGDVRQTIGLTLARLGVLLRKKESFEYIQDGLTCEQPCTHDFREPCDQLVNYE